ncbi:phenoloxidase-activating factor 2-like [Colias croceus]|uniref:phenoloxidase-activating factor 2-like n=1 Tax=Colias crocea TaxID=72248 RepID=UPI001E27DA71|nr:phenoloxidase-activating factor 2-like [Colias croceus]
MMKYLLLCLLLAVTQIESQTTLDPIHQQWLQSFLTTPKSLDPTAKSGECITKDQLRGRCVKPSECADNASDEEIDLTAIGVYRALDCHYLLKCCPRKLIITKPATKPPPVTVAPRVGCGWPMPDLTNIRTTGTDYASFGDFPWMVALLRKTSKIWEQKDYLGGGSLIHPWVVMTTAHKVSDLSKNEIKCRAGEWDTQTLNEEYEHQERDVAKIVSHEGLWLKKGINNIALLILQKPFDLVGAPHIGIACLGQSMPSEGTKCISMGWGQTEFNKPDEYAVILKKVELPIYNRDQCQVNLRKYKKLRKWTLHDSMMCAGGVEGVDTCSGDGGSPLVCEIDGDADSKRYAVYGMVSFGLECGRKDTPGVYTDVTYVYDWVKKTMTAEGLPTDSFVY